MRDTPAIDFPASKDQIVGSLQAVDAPAGVIAALRPIPPELYYNAAQVIAAADTEPDRARDPTTKAAQQRTRNRVAEQQRDVELPPLHDDEDQQ